MDITYHLQACEVVLGRLLQRVPYYWNQSHKDIRTITLETVLSHLQTQRMWTDCQQRFVAISWGVQTCSENAYFNWLEPDTAWISSKFYYILCFSLLQVRCNSWLYRVFLFHVLLSGFVSLLVPAGFESAFDIRACKAVFIMSNHALYIM